MERETELAVVEGLRRGETSAFDAVFDEFRPRLLTFLLRLTRQRALAEDLLEDTFLRLVSNAGSLRPDTRLGAWLYTVARNLYWSHRRVCLVAESHDAALFGDWTCGGSWPSPFELAAAGELERRLERALAGLSAQHREVLLLVSQEGLTPAEAAAVCGIAPPALRQRLSRARSALAEALDLAAETTHARRRYGT